MDLSIVIPLIDEEESLPELAAWIEKVMLANNYSYEIIMISNHYFIDPGGQLG